MLAKNLASKEISHLAKISHFFPPIFFILVTFCRLSFARFEYFKIHYAFPFLENRHFNNLESLIQATRPKANKSKIFNFVSISQSSRKKT